ncbi:hypothetical protein N7466_001110 [Penicillium verhagenii]|uniref:uncharacterized protein n=1 Tax=Penicillium verhagenii TaxID=1562060 RepID=UPI002545253B|nr:uncharacterized protein N7466_001110 [Penicillium verhagenii]KAJ5948095.1 hypothetical protein N7466_001110 [Penicillium verhagenii]
MYTYTPTHRFLVLSAAESVPFNPANKFLVLSPIESGPDPRAFEEEAVSDLAPADQSPTVAPKSHRSDSTSSTSTVDSEKGFLFLGHTPRRFSQ